MSYKSLQDCVVDLERSGHLIRIKEQVNPYLEMAEIQRRVFAAEGPALFFERVKGSPFPAVSNLFGTMERARFIFRHSLRKVEKLVTLKKDPLQFIAHPLKYSPAVITAYTMLPKKKQRASVLQNQTTIERLPQIQSWPGDGGPFITLPQVFSLPPGDQNIMHSNLGMYRIQLAGNQYRPNEQAGLHYQLQRGIGVHHAQAIREQKPLKVSIFVGGPPAHTFAAVMPLPEGLSELIFAGALNRRRFRYVWQDGFVCSAEADFCITGTVEQRLLPEGPFGDHLGYYSLRHPFPVLKVDMVYHRKNAVWPFTVVGRPPQEDTVFGKIIHEITAPLIPEQIPGLKTVHAVDAAGVHPLLLAVGSERYTPYRQRQPQELLTIANAALGFGQLSLAKYLFIAAQEDDRNLDVNDIRGFFRHLLSRIDWRRDVHFQTQTTMDTLDYSGGEINKGSKVVLAAAGAPMRKLAYKIPAGLNLPSGFSNPVTPLPGILLIQVRAYQGRSRCEDEIRELNKALTGTKEAHGFPLLVLVDDSAFAGQSLDNFLWVTFTRSDPAADIYGIGAFTDQKHWGCTGPLIIDARVKPHHPPVLESDPAVVKKVEQLAASGGSLHGIL